MTSLTELEADAEATRHRLHATIDRIQEKLTVSGMVDEFMGQAGVPRLETGHDFVLGLLRRHPVPVMIAAAGIGFLIYRMNQQQRDRETRLGRVRSPDVVDVPALNDGQARVYDPDLPSRHPLSTGLTGTERIGA